ncbi:MAG: hypothetical protein ACRCYS_11420 [Beijerinckiaceae bacterium]
MTVWPRMLKRSTAAAYCELSIQAFEREIIAGRLPGPVLLGGKEHWCKNALDLALDIITGATSEPEYLKELRERYGQKAA